MKLLTKRETLQQSIALMALMAAINIVVSVVAAFSIIASVFLILVLPLTSTIVTISCKEKYFPVYAIATIGLSLVATIWNIDVTLFCVVPSIISGFVFGFCIKRSIYFGWSIIVASVIQTAFSFAILPLINVFFEVDFIGDLLKIFKISDAIPGQIFIAVSFYLVALIQTFLSFIIVKNEISKFIDNTLNESGYKYFCFLGAVTAVASGPVALLSIGAAYALELLSFTVAGFVIYESFKQKLNKQLFVSLGTLVINIFVVAIFYSFIPDYYGLLIFGLTPLVICLVSFCVFLLKKSGHDIK